MKIWVSYAHDDRPHLRILESKVKEESRSFSAEFLSDVRLRLGDKWNEEIMSYIDSADAVVLLVSDHFMNSPYCNRELKYIRGTEKFSGRVFAILLDKGPWANETPEFRALRKEVHLLDLQADSMTGRAENLWQSVAERLVEEGLRPIAIRTGGLERTSFAAYQTQIMDGTFTPFIGPLCYDMRENYERALPHLRGRLKRLLGSLGVEGQDNRARLYAASIAESRIPDLRDREPAATVTEPSNFIEFQKAVARLGAAAAALFGNALGPQCKGVTDARRYRILLDNRDSGVRDFAGLLVEAAVLAHKVPLEETCLNERQARGCLGSSQIGQKLAILARCVFGSHIPIPENQDQLLMEWQTLFEKCLATAQGLHPVMRRHDSDSMTFSQLEWLGDLLWHTIRFDAPMFPRTDDLALQLSLCGPAECLARVPLGTAAAIFPGQEGRNSCSCTRAMVQYFDRCLAGREASKGRTSFHRAIAKLLWQTSIKASVDDGKQPEETADPEAVARDLDQPAQPLVITSNLDNEIERNLKMARVPYYVLFPVTCSEPVRQDTQSGKWTHHVSSAWILREEIPGREPVSYYLSRTISFSDMCQQLNSSRGAHHLTGSAGRLPGPLVVKLRGSPLHDPPTEGNFEQLCIEKTDKKAHDDVKRNAHFGPRILLSSVDFYREISETGAFPQCVKDLLRDEERVFCFLGYPLDDADSLLGLQPHVWFAQEQDASPDATQHEGRKRLGGAGDGHAAGTGGGDRVSVGCRSDDGLGPAILEGLSVTTFAEPSLEDVAKSIEDVPDLLDPDTEAGK